MTRPPASREKVLDAAERVVAQLGAGRLTYDQLVKESGVTRGGITYHFPTKEALLKALMERDMQQWEAMELQFRPRLKNANTAALIGSLRAMTNTSDDKRRFVAGMLSAVTHDPDLLEPVRQMHAERFGGMRGTPSEIDCLILELAAAGLFWQDITRCHEISPQLRSKVVARLEALAKQWSAA
jgi:AcrR family transcriptional regulator